MKNHLDQQSQKTWTTIELHRLQRLKIQRHLKFIICLSYAESMAARWSVSIFEKGLKIGWREGQQQQQQLRVHYVVVKLLFKVGKQSVWGGERTSRLRGTLMEHMMLSMKRMNNETLQCREQLSQSESANLTTADSTSVITTIISRAQTKDLCNSSL